MWIAEIHYYRESLYQLPPEKYAEVQKGSIAFVHKYMKAGKWKHFFPFANGRGGISVWEFASGEEMATTLAESPIYHHLDSQIVPLMEPEVTKRLLEAAEAASAN